MASDTIWLAVLVLVDLQLLAGASLITIPLSETAKRPTRGCPMSPYATFLSLEQQETLHELVVEARQQGADEPMVKNHIDKYVSKILSPNKYAEFQDAFEQFQANRRDRRSTEDKKLPKKIYDLIDRYSGAGDVDYTKFYEENIRKLKRS